LAERSSVNLPRPSRGHPRGLSSAEVDGQREAPRAKPGASPLCSSSDALPCRGILPRRGFFPKLRVDCTFRDNRIKLLSRSLIECMYRTPCCRAFSACIGHRVVHLSPVVSTIVVGVGAAAK